jgi:hypothetical protein
MAFKKEIVIDIPKADFLDFETIRSNRHEWAYFALYQECMKRGITVLDPSRYLASPKEHRGAILWRRLPVGSAANALIRAGARPGVLMGYEYPMYAVDFYWRLPFISADYPHTFMPGGAKKFASQKTIFHPSFPPQPYPTDYTATGNFRSRKFLTMISGNAGINPLKRFATHVLQAIRPLPGFDLRELYIDRLIAIEHFAKDRDFDLYGRGWDRPVPYFQDEKKDAVEQAIKRSYRGEVGDKLEKLKEYKFSICFENCIFDGWVTEKIIDSLFAGCIPVYWGAPDIADLIPVDTFIDFRNFKDFSELEKFLREMDEKTYNNYIANINDFIRSPLYARFSQETFIKTMVPLFESLL